MNFCVIQAMFIDFFQFPKMLIIFYIMECNHKMTR